MHIFKLGTSLALDEIWGSTGFDFPVLSEQLLRNTCNVLERVASIIELI